MKRTTKSTPNLNEEQEKLFRLVAEGDIQMIKHKLKIKVSLFKEQYLIYCGNSYLRNVIFYFVRVNLQ